LLIVKPNAEGSSKGIGSTSVVDTEDELRAAVKICVERYRQPALVEEYIAGREFTVGLLGDKRPRVLPPMEIKFKKDTKRPVYDYAVKQEWEEHVYYECPAKLTEAEQKAIEKIARATFWALDCRDVARVDMRMDAEDKKFNVIEYLKFSRESEENDVGKYNGGQKLFFWTVMPAMLLVLLTGIPLWWPTEFGWRLRQVCLPLHDIGFIFWFVAIVAHIYLGTAAEPGTFRSMVRGTVTRAWARLHHGRWFRDVTGERR